LRALPNLSVISMFSSPRGRLHGEHGPGRLHRWRNSRIGNGYWRRVRKGSSRKAIFAGNEGTVPQLQDGQVMVRNLAFSFRSHPARLDVEDTYMKAIPIGNVMLAVQSAGRRVEAPRHREGRPGERTPSDGRTTPSPTARASMAMQKLPGGSDPMLALSLLGTTGLTAYFGTLSVGSVKAGETFVVSERRVRPAQSREMIAKVKGCRGHRHRRRPRQM